MITILSNGHGIVSQELVCTPSLPKVRHQTYDVLRLGPAPSAYNLNRVEEYGRHLLENVTYNGADLYLHRRQKYPKYEF